MKEFLDSWLGSDIHSVTIGQIIVRAVFCYLFTILIVRLGSKRFMGQQTAFDVILGIILGSVVSRAINGDAPVLLTCIAAALLVLLHWLFALASFHSRWLSFFIKGKSHILIKNGVLDRQELRKNLITESDLLGELRMYGNIEDSSVVAKAVLENSGQISSVLKSDNCSSHVIEIGVEEGVKIVRIEFK